MSAATSETTAQSAGPLTGRDTDPAIDPVSDRSAAEETLVALRAGGVGVVLDFSDGGLPVVAYWGEDLGDLTRTDLAALILAGRPGYGDTQFDLASRIRLLPEHAASWIGRYGLEGSRDGRDWSASFKTRSRRIEELAGGGVRLEVGAADPVAELDIELELELSAAGLLRVRATLTNTAAQPYTVGGLRLALPVPAQAEEILDFTGRHTRERIPQRRAFTLGVHSREVRTGRTGLDAAYVMSAGRHGFSHRDGEIWSVHLGWSGNQVLYAERLYNGARLLGGGELLEHGELILASGEQYRSPWLYGAHGRGLDAIAAQFHDHVRRRPIHPTRPRPVLLNTWEAVYFNHDLAKLTALADRAAAVGVERFVLDDGWFSGRRDDTSSLGDWTVSPDMWPDGLGPLIDHVRGLGMEFGLWVEPEMVSLDSDLARAHPEWLFSAGGRVGAPSRQQHVLDLAHDGAYRHVRDQLLALLEEYRIDYLKWDHNRYLNDAGHTPEGRAGIHRHTLAAYALMDELRAAHPELEIEACSAGGGRIDLGILERTDRVWPSDCIDALERQQILRYTQLLLPPEVLGTHIGPARAHTTLRRHDLSFRAIAALWGHFGIEWDLTELDDATVQEIGRWVDFHKQLRPLLHHGRTITVDHPDPAIWINGVVSDDGREAVFGVTAVARSVTWPPGRARLPGLDPSRSYRVSVEPLGSEHLAEVPTPEWMSSGTELSGRVLALAGVELAPLHPEHSYLIRLTST